MCLNILVALCIIILNLKILSQTNDFYLFKLVWIFVTNLLNILVIGFKKPNVTEDFIDIGCSSINFTIFILNIIVLLRTLNLLTSLINFSLSSNLLKTFLDDTRGYVFLFCANNVFILFYNGSSIFGFLYLDSFLI